MCMDSGATQWIRAWRSGKPVSSGSAGIVYMLSTGSAPATRPGSAMTGACAEVGPHIMVVGVAGLLGNRPAGPRPGLRGPFVMGSGTPYAHLVVPVRA